MGRVLYLALGASGPKAKKKKVGEEKGFWVTIIQKVI